METSEQVSSFHAGGPLPPRPPPTTLRGEYVEEIIAEVGTQGPRSMLVGEEQSGGRSISGGLSSGRFH